MNLHLENATTNKTALTRLSCMPFIWRAELFLPNMKKHLKRATCIEQSKDPCSKLFPPIYDTSNLPLEIYLFKWKWYSIQHTRFRVRHLDSKTQAPQASPQTLWASFLICKTVIHKPALQTSQGCFSCPAMSRCVLYSNRTSCQPPLQSVSSWAALFVPFKNYFLWNFCHSQQCVNCLESFLSLSGVSPHHMIRCQWTFQAMTSGRIRGPLWATRLLCLLLSLHEGPLQSKEEQVVWG